MASATIFCAQCAESKVFNLSGDHNHELVAVDDKGHTLKFPLPADKAAFAQMVADHEAANKVLAEKAAQSQAEKAKVDAFLESLE